MAPAVHFLGMPNRISRATAALACAGLALAPAALAATAEGAEDEVVLVGVLAREEIEAAVPGWVEEVVSAQPDRGAATGLERALAGAEVEVYLGTWCSDSRRELGRLWRALDEAGLFEPPELTYVGVDRSLEDPVHRIGGRELRFVPTFFVTRDGAELGRIVESSPDGIERDLLALLEGRKRGLVTGRTDLEAGPAQGEGPDDHEPEGRR